MSRTDAEVTADRERAQAESRQCSICAGYGLVPVYHPRFSGSNLSTTKDGRIYTATVAAHCRCAMGTWIRDRWADADNARTPRVEDILAGRSKWLFEPLEEVRTPARQEREFAP